MSTRAMTGPRAQPVPSKLAGQGIRRYYLTVSPSDLEIALQRARSLMRAKQYPEALALYEQLAQQNQYGALWFEYGSAAIGTGDLDLGDKIWQKLVAREPDNAALLWQVAEQYGKLSMFSKANAIFFKLAKLDPGNLEMLLRMVSYLARNGALEDARATLKNCLAIDSCNDWARFFTAHLDRFEKKYEEAEALLRDLIASSPRNPELLSGCHLELAFILDNSERFDEAMEHLNESKWIAAQHLDVETEEKAVEALREKGLAATKSLPRNILDIWAGQFPQAARSPAPPLGFLGGHVRSGTTLLERIIDAHPSIAAFDEFEAYQTIVPLIDVTAPDIPAQKLNFLRQRYLKNLTVDTGPPGEDKTYLDKNPGATTALPAFLRAFPELRVIIALRDPRDVLISSYFLRPRHYIHVSLEAMAQHYNQLMKNWLIIREWERLVWMQTRYEDVVADLEKEGRRVTKFLGLEWHENQARFYESNRGKPAKNYTEVTKPIYTKAIGRWRAYEKYVAPLLPILEPYCKEFGYE